MLISPLRNTALPQGHCNSLTEFQCCFWHAIQEEILNHADTFVDDAGIKGPTSHYNDELITPGIHHFVFEFPTMLDQILICFIAAGITASGWKFILATPQMEIVGSLVS